LSLLNTLSKIEKFIRAAISVRSVHLRGLPLIPKRLWPGAPTNRTVYNEFILWIKALGLPSADWIIDVGANHGDFAQAASTVFPAAKVLLIEPLPQLQAELQDRCKSHPARWFLESVAAGSSPGHGQLQIDANDDTISSLAGFSEGYRNANPFAVSAGTVSCVVKPLDEVLAEKNIKSVDLVKIDVEGFEFEVLKGLEKSIQFIRSIIVEVSLIRLRGNNENPLASMISYLTDKGFAVVSIHASLYEAEIDWRPVEFNLLMRRPD
jgi:FkbM family methyltransferase